jgi:hypothetical protein
VEGAFFEARFWIDSVALRAINCPNLTTTWQGAKVVILPAAGTRFPEPRLDHALNFALAYHALASDPEFCPERLLVNLANAGHRQFVDELDLLRRVR